MPGKFSSGFLLIGPAPRPPRPLRSSCLTRRMAFEGERPYAKVEEFAAWPLGWKAILTRGPHDLRYVNPKIVIVEATGAVKRTAGTTDGH